MKRLSSYFFFFIFLLLFFKSYGEKPVIETVIASPSQPLAIKQAVFVPPSQHIPIKKKKDNNSFFKNLQKSFSTAVDAAKNTLTEYKSLWNAPSASGLDLNDPVVLKHIKKYEDLRKISPTEKDITKQEVGKFLVKALLPLLKKTMDISEPEKKGDFTLSHIISLFKFDKADENELLRWAHITEAAVQKINDLKKYDAFKRLEAKFASLMVERQLLIQVHEKSEVRGKKWTTYSSEEQEKLIQTLLPPEFIKKTEPFDISSDAIHYFSQAQIESLPLDWMGKLEQKHISSISPHEKLFFEKKYNTIRYFHFTEKNQKFLTKELLFNIFKLDGWGLEILHQLIQAREKKGLLKEQNISFSSLLPYVPLNSSYDFVQKLSEEQKQWWGEFLSKQAHNIFDMALEDKKTALLELPNVWTFSSLLKNKSWKLFPSEIKNILYELAIHYSSLFIDEEYKRILTLPQGAKTTFNNPLLGVAQKGKNISWESLDKLSQKTVVSLVPPEFIKGLKVNELVQPYLIKK